MPCPHCGDENRENAVFCTNCGARQEPLSPPTADLAPAGAEDLPKAAPPAPFAVEAPPALAAATQASSPVPFFTGPLVPPPAMPPEPPVPAKPAAPVEEKPVGTAWFFWLMLFGALPILGLVLHFAIIARTKRKNLRNFSVAMLIWHCVFLALILAGTVLAIVFLDQLNEFLLKYFDVVIQFGF